MTTPPLPLRLLLVDDEPLARERLRQLCAGIAGVEVIGEASNGREALAAAASLQPEVVLLDVRMPGMDGLEAAAELSRLAVPPAVLFITAYEQHALEAFAAAASGYLLKPVRREQLAAALAQLQRPTLAQRPQLAPAAPAGHLLVRHGTQWRVVPLTAVLACVADQKYVTLHTREGEFLTEDSLRQLEEEHPTYWLRVHRNALVVPAAIGSLTREADGGLRLCFRDSPLVVMASRRLAPAVLRRLGR